MQDITEQLLDGSFVPSALDWGGIIGEVDDGCDASASAAGAAAANSDGIGNETYKAYRQEITLEMLNRVPKFKEFLFEQMASELEDLLIPWDPEYTDMDEDEFYEMQIMGGINTDVQIQSMVLEALTNPDDCAEYEGEPVYRPSIMDTTYVDPNVQYREDYEEVPAKYDHLSQASLDRIYSDPQLRVVISKMPAKQINDTLIARMAKK